MSRLCRRSVGPWRLPPALFQAARSLEPGGMLGCPEEPHTRWEGVRESWELWGPSLLRARSPTQVLA